MKNLKFNKKNVKAINNASGITLIALVVTIVVLLILAGVSISLVLGDNGIISKSKEARAETVVGQEKDQIEVSYGAAIVNKLGDAITASDLQAELDKLADTTVTDNGNGTLNVLFNDTNHNYTVNKGNIETGEILDWDFILADATENPENYKHTGQSETNGDIGIGTDGEPVNLDLWKYEIIDGNAIKLSKGSSSAGEPGYQNSNIVDGKIQGKVPQYIKIDGTKTFYPVTSMENSFGGCTSLTTAPKIPSSVTIMFHTFKGCTGLTTVPEIPSSVTNMGSTFNGCKSLTTAPVIPSKVTEMGYTFSNCISLTTAPEIPSSVTYMNSTFSDCTKLQGTIVINANPSYYNSCFRNAATEGPGLTVTGSSTKLDEIIATKSSNSNITKGQ